MSLMSKYPMVSAINSIRKKLPNVHLTWVESCKKVTNEATYMNKLAYDAAAEQYNVKGY